MTAAARRTEGGAEYEQAALRADFIAQLRELIAAQVLGGDVNEIPFGGMTVLPIDGVTGCIMETFQFARGFGQHGGVKLFADYPLSPLIFFQQRRSEFGVTKTAAPFWGAAATRELFVDVDVA